ncbi:MAG: molecular chaperone [Novosphingobium sp.]
MFRIPAFRQFMFGAAALLAAASAVPAQAQGDLLVAPTRVVINNGGTAEVVLSNIGERAATYRIALELRRMDESGDFNDVAEADANLGERAALDMVRYAPRRVTLLPGQPQAVRISIRPPEGLPDGEYRVHMSFRAVPAAPDPAAPAEAGPATGVSIKLVPIYGITIPVFFRQGRLEAKAEIANPHLVRTEGGAYVEIDMARSGTRSVYGELIAKTARGDVVFNLRGVAIYAEVARRKVEVPVNAEQLAKLHGPIRIEYRELPENGGALLAETAATFP